MDMLHNNKHHAFMQFIFYKNHQPININTFYLHGCGQCAVHYENETLIVVKCSVVYTMKFRKFIYTSKFLFICM